MQNEVTISDVQLSEDGRLVHYQDGGNVLVMAANDLYKFMEKQAMGWHSFRYCAPGVKVAIVAMYVRHMARKARQTVTPPHEQFTDCNQYEMNGGPFATGMQDFNSKHSYSVRESNGIGGMLDNVAAQLNK